MADVELLPLHDGDWWPATPSEMRAEMQAYARANMEPLRAEVERLNRLLGRIVEGDGDSTLTIRADADAFAAAREYLRAEVERLQEVVRPKRENECLTLDHWRMRAYHLEANWSRCSRACAAEQTKREQAEARAERLAEALRRYGQHDDTCGVNTFGQIRCTCGFSAAQRQENGDDHTPPLIGDKS